MSSPSDPMVHIVDLCKRFTKGKETITIFDGLDLAIPRGDFVAVMGPSGSGKTTLLNLLGGIDRFDAGGIDVGGVVVERSAQPGEMISPLSAGGGFTRTGICTIVDMDSIEIEVDVNEASIGRLHAGTRVQAVLDAYPDWRIPGSVIAIVPTANREKATVKVRVGMDVKDARILPDMAIKVTFLEDGAPVTARSDSP